jgi:hypothetical protein
MKPGRRIVMAEATLGGERFRQHIEADVHIRQWFAKLFPPQMKYEDASQYSSEELFEMCSGFVDCPQFMEWHGIEMFWGRGSEHLDPAATTPTTANSAARRPKVMRPRGHLDKEKTPP